MLIKKKSIKKKRKFMAIFLKKCQVFGIYFGHANGNFGGSGCPGCLDIMSSQTKMLFTSVQFVTFWLTELYKVKPTPLENRVYPS